MDYVPFITITSKDVDQDIITIKKIFSGFEQKLR